MNRIYKINDDFFEIIDNSEKAYALGLIYSDGNIYKRKNWNSYSISITQHERDADILRQLLTFLESNIKLNTRTISGTTYYCLLIHSKKMYEDLQKLGVCENKSLILTFPDFISDEYLGDFIRGYFDGDGSIWNGKRKKMIVKNDHKPGTNRERIVHNVKFNITGSEKFIVRLQEILVEKYGFSKTKLNYSKTKKEGTHCTLEYSGRKNIKKLYDIMYQNPSIFGERKKKKFEEIINYESISNK